VLVIHLDATPSGYSCTFNVIVLYSGSLSELSVISDDPLSYPRGIGVGVFNPTTMNLLRDDITSFQVQASPESDSSLGILTLVLGRRDVIETQDELTENT
jgi:hypothetical protein